MRGNPRDETKMREQSPRVSRMDITLTLLTGQQWVLPVSLSDHVLSFFYSESATEVTPNVQALEYLVSVARFKPTRLNLRVTGHRARGDCRTWKLANMIATSDGCFWKNRCKMAWVPTVSTKTLHVGVQFATLSREGRQVWGKGRMWGDAKEVSRDRRVTSQSGVCQAVNCVNTRNVSRAEAAKCQMWRA